MVRATRLTALHVLGTVLYLGTFASIFNFFSHETALNAGIMVATWLATVGTLVYAAKREQSPS